MNNYVYIIAGLPVLQSDERDSSSLDVESIVSEIKEQCSAQDNRLIDKLLDGYKGENLDAGFYSDAAESSNSFIRDYFSFDLDVRNAKVKYLNKALGRPEGQDVIALNEDDDSVSEYGEAALAVLENKDILERERALDDLMWNRIEELTAAKLFDIDVILGFLAKLMIIDRWLKLDPETGRSLFRKMVEEIRKTKQ